jgi:hypothetical protein
MEISTGLHWVWMLAHYWCSYDTTLLFFRKMSLPTDHSSVYMIAEERAPRYDRLEGFTGNDKITGMMVSWEFGSPERSVGTDGNPLSLGGWACLH